VKYFLFSLDPSFKSKVAFVGATAGSSEKTYLRVAETKVAASPSVPFGGLISSLPWLGGLPPQ
jgi:hypothetical protein